MRTLQTLTPSFWHRLTSLRSTSRLILVALEESDIAEVKRLSRAMERDLARIKPVIEARVADPNRTEEDGQLAEILEELKGMNDRILEEIAVKSRETLEEVGMLHENRLKLAYYKSSSAQDAALLNRET